MHPVEQLIYLSRSFLPLVFTLHPVHFLCKCSRSLCVFFASKTRLRRRQDTGGAVAGAWALWVLDPRRLTAALHPPRKVRV